MEIPIKIKDWTFLREIESRKGKTKFLIECSCGKQRKVDKWDYLNLDINPHLGNQCRKCSEKLYWKNREDIRIYEILYKDYKRQAIRRNYEYNLTLKESYNLFISNCHFCGASPSNLKKHSYNKNISFLYQGIDRKNPNIGYEINNVLPCCKHCNYAKRRMTYEEFLNWVIKVHNYVVQRPECKLVGSSDPKWQPSLIIKDDDMV